MPVRSFALPCLLLSAIASSARGDEVLESLRVPEGFVVERAADSSLAAYPMFLAFDYTGTLYVAESTGKDLSGKEMAAAPECLILRLEDEDDDGVYDSRTVFADTLSLPMGLLWHHGSLYVASPPDLIRFKDTDGDGVADEREVLLTGWNVLNTASLHGPYLGRDGWLYLTHGRHGYRIQTKEGQLLDGLAARIWRCRPDGSGLERMAGGGFDNPVELIFTPGGETIGTMTYFTDPRNGERDGLMHWVEGGVYPKPHESVKEFVQTGELMPTMTKFSRIAPAGLEQYRGRAFGPEYAGILFSAQFNPHRVQMHRLIPDGATYRTEDSNFLTSTYPDFFPTDVLEDADGSLLISDTGAWYVDACPISRVAKPEVKGGIYRVSKAGVPAVDDPWGHRMGWENLTWPQVVAQLADARPRVRDRAAALLEANPQDARPALEAGYTGTSDAAHRLEIFWVLARIAGADTSPVLIQALGDSAPEIAMAAARMAGLQRNVDAVAGLLALLEHDHPGVRRQAATALGQLGDAGATGPLLDATAQATDRFLEHALIHALIQIGSEDAILAGLEASSPLTQRAAMIALDQMKSPQLTGAHVAALLASADAYLRDGALWVAGHHPEWAPDIVAFIEAQLDKADFAPAPGLAPAIQAFAGQPAVQDLLARKLQPGVLRQAAALWTLDTLAGTGISPIPESWHEPVRALLTSGDASLQSAALRFAQRHQVTAVQDSVLTLARDPGADALLRLQALSTAPPPALTDADVDLLQRALLDKANPTAQLTAARVCATSPWTADQITTFAEAYLPNMDTLTIGVILPMFGKLDVEEVGHLLVKQLLALSQQAYINLEGVLQDVLAVYPEPVRAAAAPLFAQWAAEKEQRVARLQALEPKLGQGDVGLGRRIFFGEKAACHTCHAVGQEGGTLGPDLTTIGLIRSGHDLLEALLFPSASLVPGYETVRVETLEDEFIGIVTSQDDHGLTLSTGVDQTVRVAADSITGMRQHPLSLMPEGLDAALTETELLDLITFLQSLNENQWLLPELAKQ